MLFSDHFYAQPKRRGTRPSISEDIGFTSRNRVPARLGEDLATWANVQPHVAPFARTFAYDRPGLGKSDPSPHPRTVQQMAAELHSLLHAAKVAPPYVLVGHSWAEPLFKSSLICIQAKLQDWCSLTQEMAGWMTCCAPT